MSYYKHANIPVRLAGLADKYQGTSIWLRKRAVDYHAPGWAMQELAAGFNPAK